MKRKRKSGCLGAILVVLIIGGLVIFAGRFLLDKVSKKEAKKEEISTEIMEMQPETGRDEMETERKREELQSEKEQQEDILEQNEGIDEKELSGKFYYEKLSAEEQAAYKVIAEGVKERENEIRVNYPDGNRANELFQYILLDFPEIFWCKGEVESTVYQEAEPYAILKPVYLYDKEETEQRKMEVETITKKCLSGIAEDADDYEKILYVFEYLVNTVDYDMTVDNNQYIYSALVDKRSVCAGYSRATQYLLERLGVFCTYVTGTAQAEQGNGSHAWNLVLCDGDYYYVDTTWGDPVFRGKEEEGNEDNICYDYMCCNDEELFKTHVPNEDIELPECTKMDANYYVVNGMYYTEYDSESIFEVMSSDISAGNAQSVFKFADSDTYQRAHEDIFGNLMERATQFLMDQYQLQQVGYRYKDEDQLNKITIYWQYE